MTRLTVMTVSRHVVGNRIDCFSGPFRTATLIDELLRLTRRFLAEVLGFGSGGRSLGCRDCFGRMLCGHSYGP